MTPPGAYKFSNRQGSLEHALAPELRGHRRIQRIIDSLRLQILEAGEDSQFRIRRVFQQPKEVYRLEIQLPEWSYQRTTLLERDALEELLEWDGIRERMQQAGALGGG